ncbi:MAG: hypothetical protein HY579_00890 [Nitrospinae bacterium]|nr:hypothetical protein [Nitrospinota bacterium]
MKIPNKAVSGKPIDDLPFPAEWIHSNPRQVEEILGQLPVADQARHALGLRGRERLDMLFLSPRGIETVRALPPEEIYYMVKEMGEQETLPILSVISEDQLQYIFDVEWWLEDKFLPQRALHWLALLDQCSDPQALNWFLTEEFEPKVMVLQSLIKVCKRDEMTDRYEGTEDLPHITLDGVYDIYFKVPEARPALEKTLKLLRTDCEKVYLSLMEAAIWYPVTPTVESAYRWRVFRAAERGIPEFEEAIAIYSRLDPEALKTGTPSPEDFSEGGKYAAAPRYPLADADGSAFFGQCLGLIADAARTEAIRWELVYLANKVIVADRRDPSTLETQTAVMRKVLGYVNIGLEAGAEGDIHKGEKLLERAWIQSLFQAGYGQLLHLKWQAETLLKNHGPFLQRVLTGREKEELAALADRFPQVSASWDDKGDTRRRDGGNPPGPLYKGENPPASAPGKRPEVTGHAPTALNNARSLSEPSPLDPTFTLAGGEWRDPGSLADIRRAENFLQRAHFLTRFLKICLGLNENALERVSAKRLYPENKDDLDYAAFTSAALARYTLFKEISCEPLPDAAAKTFLEIVFLPNIFPGEEKTCNPELLRAFQDRLLQTPLSWSDEDKANLERLIQHVALNLQTQFGGIDIRKPIDWQFTRGLPVAKPDPR